MSPLLDIIRTAIHHHGPMDIGTYMNMCLGHPQHGYYMTRDPLGAAGDFTTAPEVSQMFGEMVGLWVAHTWLQFGSPLNIILLECGPGRGTLMNDILRSTKNIPELTQAINIHFLETSPVLRGIQKETVGENVTWHDTLETLPDHAPLFVIANEFLDALPVRQAIHDGTSWKERLIGLDDQDNLCFVSGPAVPYGDMPWGRKDEIFEFSPARDFFVSNIAQRLKMQTGAALFVDYGHAKTAKGDTFQAIRHHQFCSVLDVPGEADLTSHVDFEQIARRAEQDGIAATNIITQSSFLKNMGIDLRLEQLSSKATAEQKQNLQTGYDRLTDKKAMGELFKAIALCHDKIHALAGFS